MEGWRAAVQRVAESDTTEWTTTSACTSRTLQPCQAAEHHEGHCERRVLPTRRGEHCRQPVLLPNDHLHPGYALSCYSKQPGRQSLSVLKEPKLNDTNTCLLSATFLLISGPFKVASEVPEMHGGKGSWLQNNEAGGLNTDFPGSHTTSSTHWLHAWP